MVIVGAVHGAAVRVELALDRVVHVIVLW